MLQSDQGTSPNFGIDVDVPWRTIFPLEKSLRLPPYGLLLMPIENLKAMEGVLPPHPFKQAGEKEAAPEDGREAET